ncbi:MAG: sirohydrochlorin chelatase [Geminicoccaceae bacterium]
MSAFEPDRGVMICGHGSRDTGAVAEFNDTVAMIRERLAPRPVESGFLEFARPIISEGLGKLRDQGVRRIDAVPGMLFAAGHVKNDVPSVLNQFAHDHEGLEVRFGRDLGIEPRLLELAKKRIEQALADRTALPREDTLLAVIGRGTSDSDANGNIAKVARMLWEGLNFPHAVVGFSGVAHPRVDACLQQAVRLGFKRIIVFPYFLFTGVLVRRIYTQTDEVAASYPEVEFVKAPYLGVHNLVVDSFIDRINGIESGDTNMNCGLCKYRTQIIGFESAVGAPQVGHHHHVEGIGTDHDHGHDHGHHHHHDHKPREH